ncbi:2-haloacid dehalogenase [Rhizobium sp. NFR07]|uniref:haloacid dehalogenase type II n=1 Tax=Rhizobium sp. NFR07 TaxID=1566262 RepID=UPI0008E6CD24|nr:haloacid dehalogenase type II [Rhizobium sp. NFR07]SFB59684.1 2-haloacid dehalogenase [Rhizobium sp. NFR07]
MFSRDPEPTIITFDCYGTLVNWHETFLREINSVLTERGEHDTNATMILESFSAQSRRLTAEKPHRLFKDILRIGFTLAFIEHGITVKADEIERFALAPSRMEPHPEVPSALRQLRERYKIAIFTNSDDDLIGPTAARIGVPFDFVINSQQAGAYKPSRQLFEYGYQRMGVRAEDTVHVAMGMYTDMKACHELGLRAVWVNRRGETGNSDWLPYEEVPDLERAAALLLQM